MPSVSPEFLDLLLTVLALSAAVGLSLYAALGVPALIAYFGLLDPPETLAGLATPPVWGLLFGLLLFELLTARHRTSDLGWNVLHTLVKPQAAFLLAALGLSNAAPAAQWALACTAAAVALLIHLTILAIRAALHTAGPYPGPGSIAGSQWVLAAAVSTLAVAAPPLGAAASAMLLFAPLPWLPQVWSAATLPLAALLSALTRPERPRGWGTGLRGLPAGLRRAVEAEFGGRTRSIKCSVATLARLGRRRPFYRGHLIVSAEKAPIFAHRRGLRARVIRLEPGSAASDEGLWVETLEVEASLPYALCLDSRAAPVSAILAAIEGGGAGGAYGLEPRGTPGV